MRELTLETLFEDFLEIKNYDLMDRYLEMCKDTFEGYEKYKGLMYVAKAEELTRSVQEE